MIREGSTVVYTGLVLDNTPALGDAGTVIALDPVSHTAHVMWSEGARAYCTDPMYLHSLAAKGRNDDGLDDSLEVGQLSFSARKVFDSEGPEMLVSAMSEFGHLGSFATYAEEAVALVASRIRSDPEFRAVIAELDEDEAETVFRTASICLIRDAFQEDE